MIIDIHTHITYGKFPEFSVGLGKGHFTVKTLLKRMDMEGIDKSVILPLVNPENIDFFGVAGNQECIETCRKHPDRLIPFCNIDPRAMLNTPKADLSQLMKIYKKLGCKGIGEICANIPITHRLCKNLFYHAGCEKMPVLFHMASRKGGLYGVIDKLHLPGLEQVLGEFPDTVFIGHAPAFWNEIDGDAKAKERESYPKGSIKRAGRLCKLLEKYPNFYGDLSAGSGFNAVSRDPEFGYGFLQKFNKKLFFGTDRFTSAREPVPPILLLLKDAVKNRKISKTAYENIMYRNFNRIILGSRK